MRLFRCIFYILFLSAISVAAQTYEEAPDSVYGLDPLLYNGRIYTFVAPFNTIGNQYLTGTTFIDGEVQIFDKVYSNLLLNYDVYNKELLIRYRNEKGAILVVALSKQRIESFSLGERYFETRPGEDFTFEQVIGTGNVKVLYRWKKSLVPSNVNKAFAFSKAVKDRYIEVNGQVNIFRNNRDFIKSFPDVYQLEIRDYIKANKIKVNKATDPAMHDLTEFGNNTTAG